MSACAHRDAVTVGVSPCGCARYCFSNTGRWLWVPACAGTTPELAISRLPKSGVAPSFRPVRDPFLGPGLKDAVVAQLVRAPVCGTGGRWFEPTQLYQQSWRWIDRNYPHSSQRAWASLSALPNHKAPCDAAQDEIGHSRRRLGCHAHVRRQLTSR